MCTFAFVGVIEDSYVAFRRALELMVLNTTCPCNACRNLAGLDLKLFLHHGLFGIQELAGRQELVGADVVLLHRLLKNDVTSETGLTAYAMYTEAALSHLGLEGFDSTLVPHTQRYEHLGEVSVWLQDMHPVWERRRSLSPRHLEDAELMMSVETTIGVRVERVWDALVQEEHYNVLAGGTRTETTGRIGGRLGEQAAYVCYHGDVGLLQTILEWRPFEGFVEATVPVPVPDTRVLIEYLLEDLGDSTRLVQRFGRPMGSPEGAAMAEELMLELTGAAQDDIDAFARHVETLVEAGGR
ncbi:MAG: DUF2652 domain-containing protein [Actinobacteria bacterium]|nr:DUF2652 domain-containing protein [Actinomycetota bacterium]